MSGPVSPTRAARLAALLTFTLVVAVGCSGVQRLSEYDATTKKNFVDSCTTLRKVRNGEVIETKLAKRSDCECVYNKIKNTYKLSADDLATYEDQVADAKAGEAPDPPDKIKQAISDCLGNTSGPAVPEATTTTEAK